VIFQLPGSNATIPRTASGELEELKKVVPPGVVLPGHYDTTVSRANLSLRVVLRSLSLLLVVIVVIVFCRAGVLHSVR